MSDTGKFDKKTLLWIAIGAVVLAIGMGGNYLASVLNQPSGNSDAGSITSAPLVEVVAPVTASPNYTIRVPGRFRSRQTVAIVGEVQGKITYLNPRLVVGGRFEQGELLLKINPVNFQAEVARAKAGLRSAEASLIRARLDNDRQKELAATGASSKAARDAAVANLANTEASVKQAEAQLLIAEENLERTEIRAPFPAIVFSENIASDSYVAPGQQLAELMDARAGELVAGLSPRAAASVARLLAGAGGDPISAIARPNEGSVGSIALEGYIENFSPSIDQASRSALVVAVFPNAFSIENEGRVFSNDFMTLEIEARSTNSVWEIPYGAIRRDKYIWLVNANDELERADVSIVRGEGEKAFVSSTADLSAAKLMVTVLAAEEAGMIVRSRILDASVEQAELAR